MRNRKSKEVNIFSASVVDLFASGLGVFLIVSIIALANQKKEVEKSKKSQDDMEHSSKLANKINNLSEQLIKLSKENLELKSGQYSKLLVQNIENPNRKNVENKLAVEVLKSELLIEKRKNKMKVVDLQEKLAESKLLISQLSRTISSYQKSMKSGDEGKGEDYHSYEIGSKFKLDDVRFYPGTDRPIEPYASREIEKLASFLKTNINIRIEISGHIFQSKRSIEQKRDSDDFNLSGKRANAVCKMLVQFGISRSRLECIGYGAKRYLYLTNDSYSKEAQLNRRVEVEILSK